MRPLKELSGNWLVLRGELPVGLGTLASITGVALVFAVWLLLSYGGIADAAFFPSPTAVLTAFWETLMDGRLIKHIWASLVVINVGFVISSSVAVPLGVLMGSFPFIRAFFEPIINFVRYLPVTAMIPLLILWVGIGIEQKITVIVIGTFFQQVVMMIDIVNRVPNELLNAAYTLGANRRQTLLRVMVPAILPGVMDMLRVTMGWAWTYLVVAELVGSSSGLGYMSMQAMRGLNADVIFVAILVIGALGILTDLLFLRAKRWFLPWSELR